MTDLASILVLSQANGRPFGSAAALAELLHLEGINDVATAGVEALCPQLLSGRSLVLLGPADPTAEQAELLLEFVAAGGGLISVVPGEALAGKLGLENAFRVLEGGRLGPVAGVYEESLPLPVWGQLYRVGEKLEGQALAVLYDGDDQPSAWPAIISCRHGKGRIIVLAYDLGQCVYLLRQGQPQRAGCRSTGISRMRPADLFPLNPRPDDAARPVADLHCHLLRELVHQAWPQETVLPWLWYFPAGVNTLMAWTSDEDWSTREQFDPLVKACLDYDASLTFYLVEKSATVDPGYFQELVGQGFDMSIHPDLPPPTAATWDQKLGQHVAWFERTYGVKPSSSVRNHCITWTGYLDGVLIQQKHGFTIDANYYSLPPHLPRYMSGSGFMMPFVQPDGTVLPSLQLAAQFSDETTLDLPSVPFSLKLTVDKAVALLAEHLADNGGEHPSMLGINSHPISFATYSSPLWTQVMALAQKQGVPVWNVQRLQEFWQARRNVRLRPVDRAGAGTKVAAQAAGGGAGGGGAFALQAMIPDATAAGGGLPQRKVTGRGHGVVRLAAGVGAGR